MTSNKFVGFKIEMMERTKLQDVEKEDWELETDTLEEVITDLKEHISVES